MFTMLYAINKAIQTYIDDQLDVVLMPRVTCAKVSRECIYLGFLKISQNGGYLDPKLSRPHFIHAF